MSLSDHLKVSDELLGSGSECLIPEPQSNEMTGRWIMSTRNCPKSSSLPTTVSLKCKG